MLRIENIRSNSVAAQASCPSDDACAFSVVRDDRPADSRSRNSASVHFKAAIADGAGTSVLPGAWAQRLVSSFVQSPGVSMRRLQTEQAAYWTEVHVPAAVARFRAGTCSERLFAEKLSRSGSHASFLGIDVAMHSTEERLRLRVRSAGDCALFVFQGGELILSYPFTSVTEFPAVPAHLCSLPRASLDLVRTPAPDCVLRVGDTVILATDEVARWILRSRSSFAAHSEFLSSLRSSPSFATWVENIRASDSEVHLDDMTVLRFDVGG